MNSARKQQENATIAAAHRESTLLAATPSIADENKRRAVEQWTENPCGAHVAHDLQFGTREFFDAIKRHRYEAFAPWMKETMGFDKFSGKQVLEIGCGIGTDLLEFARGGAVVTGIDLTPRSIEIARTRFRVYGLTGDFAVGDAESLGFPDNSFDAVYSFGVIHHTPNTAQAISEIYRVLRPGGIAIVMIYNRSSLYYWGSIVLKRGIIGLELFKYTAGEIMSRHVEYSQTGSRPLVKAYTPASARRMFSRFEECRLQIRQLTRSDLGIVGTLLPERLLKWLREHLGWNLIVKALKGRSEAELYNRG